MLKRFSKNIISAVSMSALVLTLAFSFNYFSADSALEKISMEATTSMENDSSVKSNINLNREKEHNLIAENLTNEKSKLSKLPETVAEKNCGDMPLPDGYLSQFMFQDEIRHQSSEAKTGSYLVAGVSSKGTSQNCSGCPKDNITGSHGNNRKAQFRQKVHTNLVRS